MPWVGLEPTIPVFERAKTFHVLDRAATVNGILSKDVHDFPQSLQATIAFFHSLSSFIS
jgi:hypothetical protein